MIIIKNTCIKIQWHHSRAFYINTEQWISSAGRANGNDWSRIFFLYTLKTVNATSHGTSAHISKIDSNACSIWICCCWMNHMTRCKPHETQCCRDKLVLIANHLLRLIRIFISNTGIFIRSKGIDEAFLKYRLRLTNLFKWNFFVCHIYCMFSRESS